MEQLLFIAALLGAAAGGAVWWSIATLASRSDRVDRAAPVGSGPAIPSRTSWRGRWARIAAVAAAGAGTWAVTGWPAAAAGTAALAWWWPVLFGGERAHKTELARIDAIAAWAESLRDVITAAAGLEQAVQRTAANPPPAIEVEVQALAAQVRSGRRLEEALTDFTSRVDDETADLVVMALIGAQTQAGNLAPVLDDLARTARAEAAMRMRVHTIRARTRTATRVITAATVFMLALLLLVSGDYLTPYGSLTGQMVLACALAMFGFGLWWLHRLAAPTPAPSFLHNETTEAMS
ncbi:type II secretion system F family protein [Glycomyces sp. L485]|uniref:type II secretion system F family protein n=1 Tax=Glycomyces sp. L485 TaxID=2909235 RepID=UPI001F4BC39F|nr:type II secretion system F family protein [Glycomyces sp. L485]